VFSKTRIPILHQVSVKAPDGTLRTALNACTSPSCVNSTSNYFTQEGDELVCRHCGIRFNFSVVGKDEGECNPVPILNRDRTEDGNNITVSGNFLEKNEDLFKNVKKEKL